MRNTSTVSGPLLSISSTAPAGQQNRFAAVHLLTGQLLYFIVEGKSRVKDVNIQMATYMTDKGMLDVELFSLAIIVEDEFLFTDPESKLSKYSPKGWKSSSTHGLDQNGQPLLQLHLRVKYYVDTTKFLRDDVSREHYYLQLRENVAVRGGTMEDVNHQNVLHLVALAIQADLGDQTADMEISSEMLEKYLPPKVYKNNEHKVKQTLSTMHKNNKGMSKILAQTMFVQEASPLHKAHLYRMKLNKSQPKQLLGGALSVCNNAWLAIFKNGIQLFHEGLSQALSCLYLWTNVTKMCFDRKKFELRTKTKEMLVYYADSDEKCKRIVMVCQHTIEYNERARTNDKGLKNNTPADKSKFYGLKWSNEKKSKTKSNNTDAISKKVNNNAIEENICSENGDGSDSSILTADQKTTPTIIDLNTDTTKKVSNGSVSSSEDLGYGHMSLQNSVESELDYSVQSAQDSSEAAYLMYRHPRARAGYVDNSNQSANTSSGVYTCPSYSTESKDTASVLYTTTENCCIGGAVEYRTEMMVSPTTAYTRLSSSPALPGAVSLPPPPPDAVLSALAKDDDRSGAKAASGKQQLEAAAAVDDCDGRDNRAAELYDLSAVSDGSYCAGVGATAATTASDVAPSYSLSKCGRDSGCDSQCAQNGFADAAGGGGGGDDGGRSRSGSVISNSGSFHGDGSDPPEGGRGALLSAAELSDLIVGRESVQTPRRGYYPSRPTTSSTLDSDSDYVTLPPPMNFVTGAPSLSNLSLTNFDCGSGTAAGRWDVRHSFDLLTNVQVKYCGGHPYVQVNSNNYLDVHKSGATICHHVYPTAAGVATVVPPLLHARQPPPPPPPPRPKRFDEQMEQYKQQLQSDGDFVMYPIQDPAVSHQEYVDAKLARDRVHQQHFYNYYELDPPRYQANSYLYRSTPNVASGLSLPPPPAPPPPPSSTASSSSFSYHQYQHHHQYNQNQHQLLISNNHHQLPHTNNQQQLGLQLWLQQQPAPAPPLPPVPPHLKYASNQGLLFPATVAASAEYAARNPHRPRPMYPMPLPVRSSYSHDDLLAATAAPAVPPKVLLRRRPPPPPPPVNELLKPPPPPVAELFRCTSTAEACITTNGAGFELANILDIESLREKSRNLDLPLISALCNDQTLLKQTSTLPTENKATQTVTTAVQATTPSPLAVATIAAAAAATATATKPSSHQPATPPAVTSSSSSSLLSNKEQNPQPGSVKSNCAKYTNGASSFSSQPPPPPPPSFLSAATPTSVNVSAAAVKSVKSVKSKTNHVKTNTNII